MLDFIQNLLDGLMFGSSYALLGLGFTLIFGVMRNLNLCYGPTLMVGVYAGVWVNQAQTESQLLGILACATVSVLIGWVVQHVCFRWVRTESPLAPMISAFTFWMVLEEIVVLLTWGKRYPVQSPLLLPSIDIGDFSVRGNQLILFVVAWLLMAVIFIVIYRTPFGRQARAVGENPLAARLVGINVNRVSNQLIVIVYSFGSCAAYFVASSLQQITPNFGLWTTVKALVVLVLGGLGSIPGAIVGGLVLGVTEAQATWYLGASYRDMAAYFLLFLLLIFMPKGLFLHFRRRGG